MNEGLLSVGLDVGTTTMQMAVSRLHIVNAASAFSVPRMTIGRKEILYRSEVCFTPLQNGTHMDGEAIRRWLLEQYRLAGITPEQVDTGAVIITGESSRKENAQAVTQSLSEVAGDFVVAAAGPDLESVLAAKGAGAAEYSEKTGKTLLHMDIGGGTSNLALIQKGRIVQTGCLNVGGRLLKIREDGVITYVSPVLEGLTDLQAGDRAQEEKIRELARLLTCGLEMAAGLREKTELLDRLLTREASGRVVCPPGAVISLSGGVADCVRRDRVPGTYGDLGPELGTAIRESLLLKGEYYFGQETIGATVIGAGCHAAQLSGSTVYCRNVSLPLKNLPVVCLRVEDAFCADTVRDALTREPGAVLFLEGEKLPDYSAIRRLAGVILEGIGQAPAYLAMEGDFAKALGQCIHLQSPDRAILSMDGLTLSAESFLDVGEPAGPAYPVIIKTLVFGK